jgi:hypothetical protein
MTEKSEALRLAKSEALRLADELQAISKNPWAKHWERYLEAAAELHRLSAVNAELLEALKDVLRYVSPVADGAINARAAIARAEGEKT